MKSLPHLLFDYPQAWKYFTFELNHIILVYPNQDSNSKKDILALMINWIIEKYIYEIGHGHGTFTFSMWSKHHRQNLTRILMRAANCKSETLEFFLPPPYQKFHLKLKMYATHSFIYISFESQ